jgi:thiamine pyrophosphate-dependent acetolactate synthase large subunit-like protein
MGIRVQDRFELDEALAQVFDHDGPAMLEVITDGRLI